MMAIMSPLLLVPDFKKLSTYSGAIILCCITSICCILGYEIFIVLQRIQGMPVQISYSDDNGKVVLASEEKMDTAFDFNFLNLAMLPGFMGSVLSIFEGNVGLLNIYSQQNEPRSMFCQTLITHMVVFLLCSMMGTLSYLAYGNLVQDIVLYNLPQNS